MWEIRHAVSLEGGRLETLGLQTTPLRDTACKDFLPRPYCIYFTSWSRTACFVSVFCVFCAYICVVYRRYILCTQRLFRTTREETHAGCQCSDRRSSKVNNTKHAKYTHKTYKNCKLLVRYVFGVDLRRNSGFINVSNCSAFLRSFQCQFSCLV